MEKYSKLSIDIDTRKLFFFYVNDEIIKLANGTGLNNIKNYENYNL